MEILGIGPLEFVLVVLLALILLGPKDLIQTGRKLGDALRKLTRSSTWRTLKQTSNHIRDIPGRLMQETGLEEEVKKTVDTIHDTVGPKNFGETWIASDDNPKEEQSSPGNMKIPPEKDPRK